MMVMVVIGMVVWWVYLVKTHDSSNTHIFVRDHMTRHVTCRL